jgi:cellulose synthase/poly-beta-1,6-N-acetylglucosamine synthase-like glycosyltransferase
MMNFFFAIWYIFQSWLAMYIILPSFFLLIYLFKKISKNQFDISKKAPVYHRDFDFAAIVTAHKEILLVPALIDSLLKQNYQQYLIYIVADACDISSLYYSNPRIIVLKPEADLNAKIRSIDYAIARFQRPHDALIIFDSDNLVHPHFLSALNQYFQKGFKAVQANLLPKNTDSLFARIDAVGNTFSNFIEREIRMELGLSSAIWGSGIALDTALYRQIAYDNLLGGFDKRVQADIAREISQIAFAKEAIVYDEKISNGPSLQKQRTRWLHAYFKYFNLSLKTFLLGLKRFNINLGFFGFVNLRPPFFIVFFLGCGSGILNYWVNYRLFFLWIIVLSLFIFSFLVIILLKANNRRTFWSVFFMPVFIIYQIAALIKVKKASKVFLKTEHNKLIYIEDLLRNESV